MVNDKGAAGTFNAPDALFARDFNEALVHQIVVAFQATRALARARRRIAARSTTPPRSHGGRKARAAHAPA